MQGFLKNGACGGLFFKETLEYIIMDINSHTTRQKVGGSLIRSPIAEKTNSSVTKNVSCQNSSILAYKILRNSSVFGVFLYKD